MLSEEDKARIQEEEEAREAVRSKYRRQRFWKWAIPILVIGGLYAAFSGTAYLIEFARTARIEDNAKIVRICESALVKHPKIRSVLAFKSISKPLGDLYLLEFDVIRSEPVMNMVIGCQVNTQDYQAQITPLY